MNLFSTRLVKQIAEVHEDFGMWGVNGEIKQIKKEYDLAGDDTRYLRKLVKLQIKENGFEINNNQKG